MSPKGVYKIRKKGEASKIEEARETIKKEARKKNKKERSKKQETRKKEARMKVRARKTGNQERKNRSNTSTLNRCGGCCPRCLEVACDLLFQVLLLFVHNENKAGKLEDEASVHSVYW